MNSPYRPILPVFLLLCLPGFVQSEDFQGPGDGYDKEEIIGALENEVPGLRRALTVDPNRPHQPKSWWRDNRDQYYTFDSGASMFAFGTVLAKDPENPVEEALIPGQIPEFRAPLPIYVHGRDVSFKNPETGQEIRPNEEVTMFWEIYPKEKGARVVVHYNGKWRSWTRRNRLDENWHWVRDVINGVNAHIQHAFADSLDTHLLVAEAERQLSDHSRAIHAIEQTILEEDTLLGEYRQKRDETQATLTRKVEEFEAYLAEYDLNLKNLEALDAQELSEAKMAATEAISQLDLDMSGIAEEISAISNSQSLTRDDVARELELRTTLKRKSQEKQTTESLLAGLRAQEFALGQYSLIQEAEESAYTASTRFYNLHDEVADKRPSLRATLAANRKQVEHWEEEVARFRRMPSSLDALGTASDAYIAEHGHISYRGLRLDNEAATVRRDTSGLILPDSLPELPALEHSDGPASVPAH